MQLQYHILKLVELPDHEWWDQIKSMHLPDTKLGVSVFKKWFYRAEYLKPSCKGINVMLCSHNDEPIAIVLYGSWDDKNNSKITDFMVYVEPQFRRMGIGKKLFAKVNDLQKTDLFWVHPHDKISHAFFDRVYPKHIILSQEIRY